MGKPQKEPPRELTETERAALQRMVQASSERVDRVRALLAVAAGGSFAAAAREAGLRSGSSVANLIVRFNRQGLAALSIGSGCGRKPTYDATAREHDVATAQTVPDRRRDGTATWSLSTLQKRLRKEGGWMASGRTPSSACWRTRQFLPEDAQLVSDGNCPAGAQGRRGHGRRSRDGSKKGMIERTYWEAEAAGIVLCNQDEAGSYQAVPYPGESWHPEGSPGRQPHEYVRNGTAKLLTLFRPATGEVRAKGVRNASNAVLHPWLKEELGSLLATLPAVTTPEKERPEAARWATWLDHEPREPLPPLRMILVWDNLAGHLSWSIVRWLFQHGIVPLYTPLSRSWLNLSEALQLIIVRCALSGQHPQSPEEIITWLEDTVAAWNEYPTSITWGGKRKERRDRARQRRLGGSPTVPVNHQSNVA